MPQLIGPGEDGACAARSPPRPNYGATVDGVRVRRTAFEAVMSWGEGPRRRARRADGDRGRTAHVSTGRLSRDSHAGNARKAQLMRRGIRIAAAHPRTHRECVCLVGPGLGMSVLARPELLASPRPWSPCSPGF